MDDLKVRLTTIWNAARDINLYAFEPLEGGRLPPADAGAHIGLHLPNGMLRQYSLVAGGQSLSSYVIGVKRDGSGRGGSSYVHDKLRVGQTLKIDPPRNNFPLDEAAKNSIFFAGGIGITPIYSMMLRLQELGKSFKLYYCSRARQDAVFADKIEASPHIHMHFDDERNGEFLDVAKLVGSAPLETHLYCCGPAPMLSAFEAAAKSRKPEEVHVEYFTQKYETALEGGFVLELARSNKSYEVPAGKTILQTLLADGFKAQYSCQEGVCGACETQVLDGIPDHRDSILSTSERSANKTMMICCSGSKTDRLVLDL